MSVLLEINSINEIPLSRVIARTEHFLKRIRN